MANNYREVLKSPGFLRVITSQLLARFPFGMMSLALVMHIQHVYDSYAIAGFALGAETVGAAISGPLLSRFMAKAGVTRVIIPASIATALAMFGIAFYSGDPLVTIALSAIVGLTSPPIQAAARTVYPTLVKKRLLSSVYALDATAQELIWVIGPVLATILAAQINTAFPVIVMATLQIAGAWAFVANKEVSTLKIPKSNRRIGGVLKSKVVFVNVILGMLLIGSFSGVEVGTVAILGKELAGPVIAVFSIGSILGGVILGNRNKGKWALTRFFALIAFGYLLVFINPTDAVWMSIAWFIAGLGIAPALGTMSAIIGATVKTSDAPEAYGWSGTGQLMGYSAGAALAGIAIDVVSPTASLLIAIVFGLGATLVAVMSLSITPALGKQQTDTQSLPIIKE
jgi:MFS family permease